MEIKKKRFLLLLYRIHGHCSECLFFRQRVGYTSYLLAVYCLIAPNSLWFLPLGWPPGPPSGDVAEVGDPPVPPPPPPVLPAVPDEFFKSDWKKLANTSWEGAFCWLGLVGDTDMDAALGIAPEAVGVDPWLPPPGEDKGDMWPFLLLMPFKSSFSKLRSYTLH